MGNLTDSAWRRRHTYTPGAKRVSGDRRLPARNPGPAIPRLRGVLMLLILVSLPGTPGALAAPATYDALLQAGLASRNAGDFQAAEQSFRAARELAARTSEADSLLGVTLAFQGRLDDALSLLDDSLRQYPDDLQLQLARARVLLYRGDHAESLVASQRVLSVQPASPEALLLAARASFYQQDLGMAQRYYSLALEADPDNLEALLGLHDTALDSGDGEAARARLAEAARLAPAAPEVVARQAREQAASGARHELVSSLGFSNIKGSALSNWHDRALEYRYTNRQGHQVFLRTEYLDRFDRHDTLSELGTVFQWRGSQPVELAFAYGPDADFSPQRRVRVATSLQLPTATERLGTTLLDIAYVNASYVVGDVTQARLGITHYFKGFDGWLNTAALRIRDENQRTTAGWTTGLHWQTSARLRLGYAYTDAPETENNITTETRTHHVYASLQL